MATNQPNCLFDECDNKVIYILKVRLGGKLGVSVYKVCEKHKEFFRGYFRE